MFDEHGNLKQQPKPATHKDDSDDGDFMDIDIE